MTKNFKFQYGDKVTGTHPFYGKYTGLIVSVGSDSDGSVVYGIDTVDSNGVIDVRFSLHESEIRKVSSEKQKGTYDKIH